MSDAARLSLKTKELKPLLVPSVNPTPKFLYCKVVSNESVAALFSVNIIIAALGVPKPGSSSTETVALSASV